MKPLKPTLREKNRYVAVEVVCDRKCTRDEVVKAVWNTILRFLGELNASKMSLWVMDWNDEKQRGILKVNHKSVKDLRIGLTMLGKIGENRASTRVLGVSGTLKQAREYLEP
ncbi:MAG: ribonuclease P protein component 2 [Candidatus Altiarchaeales archaeon]|nr:ribonuclease P protein component 2 [Candidatus Altiarchaeales archaeon]